MHNNPHTTNSNSADFIEVERCDGHYARWLAILALLLAVGLTFVLGGCVTAADTEKMNAAQHGLEQAQAAAQADLAAGVPPAQVQEAMRVALAEYTAQMKAAGQDVANRTATMWDVLKGDPLGGGITLLLSQLPLLLGLNARRNATRKTDPNVSNRVKPAVGTPGNPAPLTPQPHN